MCRRAFGLTVVCALFIGLLACEQPEPDSATPVVVSPAPPRAPTQRDPVPRPDAAFDRATAVVDLGLLRGRKDIDAAPVHFPADHFFVRFSSRSSSCTTSRGTSVNAELAIGFEGERVHFFYWTDRNGVTAPSNACALHATWVEKPGGRRDIEFTDTRRCRYMLENVPEKFVLRCQEVTREYGEALRCKLDDSTRSLKWLAHPGHGDLELGRPGLEISSYQSALRRRKRTSVSAIGSFTSRLSRQVNRYRLPPL